MNSLLRWSIRISILLILSSCTSNKPIIYLTDLVPGTWQEAPRQVETQVSPNDCLEIIVGCSHPELAIPFNGINNYPAVKGTENYTDKSGEKLTANQYRVDNEGMILFPVIGKIKVVDLSFKQIEELIAKKIIEGGYINEPEVVCRLKNFKYTVLGAVARNGVYQVEGDRVTILEAIANAGDLTDKAKADRIVVIREENGARVSAVHDLRSSEIFTSPFFYLKPNDVVYVEPRYRKKDIEDRSTQYLSLILSVASVVTSVIWVLAK